MLDDTQKDARPADEPGQLLQHEHASARRLCALALSVAERDESDLARVAAAAARVARYVGVDLHRHEAEEEELLGGALVAHDPTVAPAFGLIMTQHVMLRGACHELGPLWTSVAHDPRQLVTVRRKLASSTRRLVEMLDLHHELEEGIVLPRLATLPEADRRALLSKMLDRRAAR